MTTLPPVAATSRLRLCPFFVKGSGDRYTVVHREGRQAIRTGRAGVEAIRLLDKGKSIEHTRRILGQRYGHPPEEIDLGPLLETLFLAGFVRFLDGRQVAPRHESGRHDMRLWLTLFVWSPLLQLALKHLPPRLALPLAYRWFGPDPSPELEGRIAANLRHAPDLAGTDRGIARVAAANREALHKQFCDRLLFGAVPPRRLRRWLGEQLRVTGLEQLARARLGPTGTILCSLHVGSYGLIPFVLAARGVPVTVHAGFGGAARADVDAWLAERSRQGDLYPVRIAQGAMALRTMARCLEQGRTVLIYCDQSPGAGGPPGARGWIRVPFLGTHIWSARGLGWLRHQTGAAVLPVVLLWEGRRGHHLRIDPPLLDPGTNQSNHIDALVTAAYGALEPYVQQAPAQWLKWVEFGEMIAPKPG